MSNADRNINEALRLHDLAKDRYFAAISSEQRDPEVARKLRLDMDASLKHFVDVSNEAESSDPQD